jgi:hypothetical protein
VLTFEFIIVFNEGVVVFCVDDCVEDIIIVVELVVELVVNLGFCVEDFVVTVILAVELVVFVVVGSEDDNASTGKRFKIFEKKITK